MKNRDLLEEQKEKVFQRIEQAVKADDSEGFAQAFADFADGIQQQVLQEARQLVDTADATILSARGVRQLTSGEAQYYSKVIGAMQSSNPKQALTDLDVVMPKTVIDAVFEDLQTEHPLLEAINFQNTAGMIEMLINTDESQLATWDSLTAAIATELTSGFKKVNMSLSKLSAFIPIAKAMLDLGPAWVDRYIRTILSEAIAFGLEKGIVSGTGKNQPIGMDRQVGEGVTVTDGVYPQKTPIVVTEITPTSYGALIAQLAKTPKDKYRKVTEVLLVANPVDVLKTLIPATTVRGADGNYINGVFPFPTKLVQSTEIEEGRAILGLPAKYTMGIGTAKSGKIEYSDEYKFLEDERVYLTKLYGHGEPNDNNAFLLLDISGLKPTALQVEVVNNAPITNTVRSSKMS